MWSVIISKRSLFDANAELILYFRFLKVKMFTSFFTDWPFFDRDVFYFYFWIWIFPHCKSTLLGKIFKWRFSISWINFSWIYIIICHSFYCFINFFCVLVKALLLLIPAKNFFKSSIPTVVVVYSLVISHLYLQCFSHLVQILLQYHKENLLKISSSKYTSFTFDCNSDNSFNSLHSTLFSLGHFIWYINQQRVCFRNTFRKKFRVSFR